MPLPNFNTGKDIALWAYCEELRAKGATFVVEPWEFGPSSVICYLAAPDGVSIEIMQAPEQ